MLLHDALLHHLVIGTLDEGEYVEEFVYNYGGWATDLARTLWAGRARAMSDPRYFRYPLVRRLPAFIWPWWCTERRPGMSCCRITRRRCVTGDSLISASNPH
ncbi:MAG: hypothetical protein U5J83_18890 [Bryobacterales bacterium]|nr:hypothetical protein [Bryobacterales bacterium]